MPETESLPPDFCERIVLVGFSGSGKSTVARLLGEALGWPVIDLDDDLAIEFGVTVPGIFATHGEALFRTAERRHLQQALARRHVVVATGGGAAAEPDAWSGALLGDPSTLTVTLDAAPKTMLERLRQQQAEEGVAAARPMIDGDNSLQRITELKTRRQPVYDRSNVTLIVDRATPRQVTEEVLLLVRVEPSEILLQAASGESRIRFGSGIANRAARLVHEQYPQLRRAWIITDEHVAAIHGQALLDQFTAAGISAAMLAIPPGESSKSMQGIGRVYDWMLASGVERGDVVIALGGGVIGDLAGFVAATMLRGIGLVQIPTSLLAMVDSSVGGKTGINHPAGKNLIGAFYQAPLVLIDPGFLLTLPPRELRQGWAEIIKHAVIQPSTPGDERDDLIRFLQRNREALLSIREPAISYLIRRNVALKSAVVMADEREAGIRALLNFGHTLGHAMEAVDYRLLHGEAVALGMRAAMRIGQGMEMIDKGEVEEIDALLTSFGLPETVDTDPDIVLTLTSSDKKRTGGTQRWVLPAPGGGVAIRDDIPWPVVATALEQVIRRSQAA